MSAQTIIFIKYAIAIILIAAIVCAPAYLAQQTQKNNTDMARIRIGSWLLGWSVIAWLWALFESTKK